MIYRKILLILNIYLIVALGVSILYSSIKENIDINQQYHPPPSNMVLVPAGRFLTGSNAINAEYDEKPQRSTLINGFYIDIYEVTNREYQKFKASHNYQSGHENLPATGILRSEARDYCEFYDKRLPTGEEWEKAARGNDGRIYPWGNNLEDETANIRGLNTTYNHLLPVGSFPKGVSPYGCFDMSGNAWEWVSDNINTHNLGSFDDGYIRGVIRGGGFNYSPFQARTSYQGFEDPNLTCNDVGFRCVKDAAILD